MTYSIAFTSKFQKDYDDLTQKEQKQFAKKVALLATDPSYPSLRAKHLQGTNDLFEFSVNMSLRVIWKYDGKKIILLLAIGKHDILKKWGGHY